MPKTPKIWLFLIVLGLSGCGQLAVNTHPLPQPLPTQRIFKGSVYEVQKAINEIFKNHSEEIFQDRSNFPPTFTLYWKGDHHPDGIKIFKNPVNENDVYISCNHNPVSKTKMYTDWLGRPVEFAADFQLHIIPQEEETLVKVIVVNPQVVGRKNVLDVQPTTVEENEILKVLQESLDK
jgi:hypothetical protein